MAKCTICGTEYYMRECPTCKNGKELSQLILKQKKHTKTRILIVAVIILGFLIITPYAYITKKRFDAATAIENANVALKLENEMIQNKNAELEYQLRQMRYELEALKRRAADNDRMGLHVQPSGHTPAPTATQTKPYQEQHITPRSEPVKPAIQAPKSQQQIKMYDTYSHYIKLLSDSRITKGADNRLHSNMKIYGEYQIDKPDLLKMAYSSPQCPDNKVKRSHDIIDQCRIVTVYGDKLYFSYMKRHEFEKYRFNFFNKKIKCEYSKTFGIMENCSIESVSALPNR